VPRSRRSRRTLTLIIAVVVSLSLISLDLNGRTHSLTSGIKSVANGVYSPLRQGVEDIIRPIGNFFAGAFNYGAVQSENEQLQRQIGQLRATEAEKGFEQNQLRELTQLENLPYLNSLPTVTAQTQDEYSSNFTATITLDKGRDDGVDVGYPVVGAGGLVGQVIQSFHHTSVVRLITDGQSKVGVVFGPGNKYTAIVDGQGPGNDPTADLVAPGTPLRQGETMYTSGLQAAAFPPGIPVASVSSFHTPSGASQISVTVEPSANLNQLAYVDVVQWAPNT
jgi:rod shape-determining protein MreC